MVAYEAAALESVQKGFPFKEFKEGDLALKRQRKSTEVVFGLFLLLLVCLLLKDQDRETFIALLLGLGSQVGSTLSVAMPLPNLELSFIRIKSVSVMSLHHCCSRSS